MTRKTEKQDFLRVLAVDDEEETLDLFRKIFTDDSGQTDSFGELSTVAQSLFGAEDTGIYQSHSFDLVTCKQAEDAVQLFEDSIKRNNPYSVVFLDVRMPPGHDGVWAAEKIRSMDKYVNIVIVTAYSDVHPQEIAGRVGSPRHLLYIQKPFYRQEIYQLAVALSENWLMQRRFLSIQDELTRKVEEQTESLRLTNRELEAEVLERKKINEELQKKSEKLISVNNALEVLLDKRENDREELEERIMLNVRDRVRPYITKLMESNLTDIQQSYIQIIEANISELVSSFTKSLSSVYLNLTPTEIEVANFIKSGKSTKDISEILHISDKTVETHRKNIRKKLGVSRRKENLRTYLLALEKGAARSD